MTNASILQFALAKGIGDVALKKIIAFASQHEYSWEEMLLSSESFLAELGFRSDVIQNVRSAEHQAQALFEELISCGIEILIENENNYPQYLKKMLGIKCPPILFAKGNISLLNTNAVGFCGSRKASLKGVDITANCAMQFAQQNITVVSGYAAGTDLAAHKASLASGGNTIFVLAEGILRSRLKNDIKGLINDTNYIFISQFMPKSTWNVGNAMKRNSIIIGLSRAMVLVESGKSGGTFAAGEEALRVGCPLFVIDFEKPEVSAEANPYFIAAGGQPIRGKNGIPNLSKVIQTVNHEAERENTKQLSYGDNEQIRLSI